MIERSTDYEVDEGKYTSKCCCCGRVLDDKWISYVPIGSFCIKCAQTTMRILFQDIISYHNNSDVSLLNIMYHGRKEGEQFNPGVCPNDRILC